MQTHSHTNAKAALTINRSGKRVTPSLIDSGCNCNVEGKTGMLVMVETLLTLEVLVRVKIAFRWL